MNEYQSKMYADVKAGRPKNLKATIDLFKRVKANGDHVNLCYFQAPQEGHEDVVHSEAFAHSCGTICCVAGWVGVSPSFLADGGDIDDSGAPYYKDKGDSDHYFAAQTMARYWGLPISLCELITATTFADEVCDLYQVDKLTDVKSEHIISVLEKFL